MIKGYPEGYDLTILDTSYMYPRKQNNGKYSKDTLSILYKDNVSGEKKIEVIEEPTYKFYKANDEVLLEHNLFFIEKEKVHEIEVPYRNLLKTIAEETGNEKFFYDNIRNGNRYGNNQLHTVPEVFSSDMHIDDHFRFRFDRFYENRSINISKAYFDIEADTEHMVGDFPEMGECPINAISFIDTSTFNVHTFLLRDNTNEQIPLFEEQIPNGLFEELKSFIYDHVGEELFIKYGLNMFEFNMYFYDEEIQLIQDFFSLVNTTRPDFLLAWNMKFDIPYIVERIKILGYYPEDIMCHQSLQVKNVKYYLDEKNRNNPADTGDYYSISGYTIYLDQLVQFAARRKGQSVFDSNKLDYIGEVIAKVGKLDYSHITRRISELPKKDYKVFVFYSIMDTIVQYCIEFMTGDVDYIFNKCLLNNTRYHKGHRQTVYLTNRGVKEFEELGYIMGNNINRGNEKPPKFPGALVGDPLNNNDYSKEKINGIAINIVRNLIDFDYKSLYPSIMIQHNIAPNTQIGLIKIDQQVYDGENPFDYDKYSRSGQFLQDFMSDNYIVFARRWLHLASFKEMIEDVNIYMKLKEQGKINITNRVHMISPAYRNNYIRFNKVSMITMLPNPDRVYDNEMKYLRDNVQLDIDSIDHIIRRKERYKDEGDLYIYD